MVHVRHSAASAANRRSSFERARRLSAVASCRRDKQPRIELAVFSNATTGAVTLITTARSGIQFTLFAHFCFICGVQLSLASVFRMECQTRHTGPQFRLDHWCTPERHAATLDARTNAPTKALASAPACPPKIVCRTLA